MSVSTKSTVWPSTRFPFGSRTIATIVLVPLVGTEVTEAWAVIVAGVVATKSSSALDDTPAPAADRMAGPALVDTTVTWALPLLSVTSDALLSAPRVVENRIDWLATATPLFFHNTVAVYGALRLIFGIVPDAGVTKLKDCALTATF